MSDCYDKNVFEGIRTHNRNVHSIRPSRSCHKYGRHAEWLLQKGYIKRKTSSVNSSFTFSDILARCKSTPQYQYLVSILDSKQTRLKNILFGLAVF